MVRNSPAGPRTYFQPMLKIEQQWNPAKEGGGQVLDYNVEHNHHSPGRLELILPIMLDWETVFVNSAFRNWRARDQKYYCIQHNSQLKLFSHIQVSSSVGECKGEAVSVGERRQTSGTRHLLHYPSLWHWNILDRKKGLSNVATAVRLEKPLNISNLSEMVTYI